MADQTVSLKLVGDASDLRAEVDAAGRSMEDLAGKATDVAQDTERALTGASSAWEDHSGMILGVSAAAGTAGLALEGFNRSQQDTRAIAGRVANALEGETTSSVMGLAAELHNATTDMDALVYSMEVGRQQGLTTGEQLQDFAAYWDMVADATGESHTALSDASVALRTVGIDAGNEGEALAAFGFISQETTSSVGEFLQFLQRTGPELRDMGLDVNDAAAMLGILEREFGMSGRVARQEFRSAVNEANGDLSVMLDTLGISEGQFQSYRAEVEASSGVIEANAAAYAETRTAMQGIQAWLESTAANFSGVAEAASLLSPVLTGAGGAVIAVDGLRRMLGDTAISLTTLKTGAQNFGRFLVGPWGIALAGGAAALKVLMDHAAELDRATYGVEQRMEGASSATDVLADSFLEAELKSRGVWETWSETGLSLDTLRGAMMGVESDLRAVVDATDVGFWSFEYFASGAANVADMLTFGMVPKLRDANFEGRELNDAMYYLLGGTEDLIPALEELDRQARNNEASSARLTGQAEAYGVEVRTAADATGVASDAAGDYETAMQDLEGQIEDTRSAQQRYIDDVRAAEDPVFALDRALRGVEDAQQAYTQAVAEYGAESREAQQASFELMGKLSDLERAAIDGDLSFSAFDDRLQSWVDQGRITADQADATRTRVRELTGAANDYAGNYTATIQAETASSEAAIARVQAALGRIPRFTHTTVVHSTRTDGALPIRGQATPRAEGGPVGPGEVYWVGEEGPELVTFGQPGYVVDAATSAQIAPALAAGHDSGQPGTALTQDIKVYGDVRRETLAEARHQMRMAYVQMS